MGAEPDKGGTNYNHIAALQNIFAGEKSGRVLVSDYTTEAKFIIPDLNKVLGSEKYRVVNEDIQNGLQNIFFSDAKYSGNEVKTKIFLKRLNDARNEFLSFFQPQIDQVCESMGLKAKSPQAKFTEIDMNDDVALKRATTRLIELGIIHPQDGLEVIKTGKFPSQEEHQMSQQRLVDEREKGWYNPLVGGVPVIDSPEGSNNTPTKVPKQDVGRPSSKASKSPAQESYKAEDIVKASKEVEKFFKDACGIARKVYDRKKLTKEQKSLVEQVCETITQSKVEKDWRDTAENFMKGNLNVEDLDILPEIKKIACDLDLDFKHSALMFHSKNLFSQK